MNQALRVGWLGAGVMGAPMARNVRAAGHQVTIWNRTAAKAEPLAEHGLRVAGSAAEAAEGCDLLVTMLADVDAVVASLNGGPDGGAVLDRLGFDAVWVQMSTVGVEGCSRLATLARDHDVDFVDAPVSGTLQAGAGRRRPASSPCWRPGRQLFEPDVPPCWTLWARAPPGSTPWAPPAVSSWC